MHGGGFFHRSSIVKVPGNVPPARKYFFGLLVWPRVFFSLGKGMLLAILVNEKSNFGYSCIETQNFYDFGLKKAKIWQFLFRKLMILFDVEFSIAKGIIFKKIV